MATSPVEQALDFVFPCYQRIAQAQGYDKANLWLYEVDGRFDRFAKFLTVEEKEELRGLVRGKLNLSELKVTHEDLVKNKPRPQLYDS